MEELPEVDGVMGTGSYTEIVPALEELMAGKDSCGGVVECIIRGMPAGAGEPVFEKLDATWLRPCCPSARSRDLR